MRKCRTCGVEKELEEFYKSGRKNRPEERHTECKDCTKVRVKNTQSPSKMRSNHLQRLYGITLDDYDSMYEKQNGQCAICGTTDPGGRWNHFAVDHDHETGAVRELLCNNCNTALGLFKDSADLLRSAADYLDKHVVRSFPLGNNCIEMSAKTSSMSRTGTHDTYSWNGE